MQNFNSLGCLVLEISAFQYEACHGFRAGASIHKLFVGGVYIYIYVYVYVYIYIAYAYAYAYVYHHIIAWLYIHVIRFLCDDMIYQLHI